MAESKRVTSAEPERRMLLAMLEDAIQHVLAVGLAAPGTARSESERWLFSNDRNGPFSFVNVSETLGIDPSWVRERLLRDARSRKRQVTPPRSPKRAARRNAS